MSRINFSLSVILIVSFISCKSGNDINKLETDNSTPVTLTQIQVCQMNEVTELNATSVFMVKSYLKSPVNGYLQEVNAQLGESVNKGSRLFTVRTKEAEYLNNTINQSDSAFHFKGTTNIIAPCNGYITELNYRPGDYVQDGETLATISDINSFAFMLELPYNLKPSLSLNKTLKLILPDGQKISGTLISAMPTVDPVSQTQSYRIKVSTINRIPENLIANVQYVNKTSPKAITLSKGAILTDEIQSEFWIMKMINDSTAVKIPIVKGIENTDRVEILSPILLQTDKILLTGNYGLPDTAKVIVENQQ